MSPSPFETTPSSPERQPSPDSETEGFERQPSPDSETEGFERQPSPDSEIEGFERQPSPDSETEGFERQPSPDSEIEGFKRQPSPNSDTESFERLSSPDNETEGYKRQSSPDSDTEGFKRQPNECDDPKMRQSSEDKRRIQNEREKDSGFSDTSSECLSPEENAESEAIRVPIAMQEKAQVAYPPIYILQNIILKQRLLIIQPGPRRHRTHSSSYLPILRSYPRIAPRLAQPPAPDSSSLLDVSLRAFALLRRSRETQRALRELRAHTQLFRRAAQGEKGGWETLRRAMEKSGSYWRPVTTSGEL
ncbi:uncharacterized protein LOC142499439 [Ascaphus truei]|uniref:uncharacterized protein LOC142499439 n=1 Tax=Ascaphus truei TaxID=8439 RepID=UPI003F594D56